MHWQPDRDLDQDQQGPCSNTSGNDRCPATLTRVTSNPRAPRVEALMLMKWRSADIGGPTGVAALMAIGAGPSFPCFQQAGADPLSKPTISHIYLGKLIPWKKLHFLLVMYMANRSIKIYDIDVKMT